LAGRPAAVGMAAAAVLVFSALPPSLTHAGIGQFGGPIDVAGFIPGVLWTIWLSLRIARGIPSHERGSQAGREQQVA
ncbi:MAG: hypothetical protein QOH57_4013, partial [Mycobacterium sp.]|nr:hypothetical protein [Mycobacterium sp.]